MKSISINNINSPVNAVAPLQPVLSRQLQQALHRLAESFRAQVHNAIAVTNWLQRQNTTANFPQKLTVNPQYLQQPVFDTLTFRFVSSPEAFKLFTETLVRRSFFLQYHSDIDLENQLLKIRLHIAQLPEWEQELSILFENITIAVYLDTLLSQQQQSRILKRKAG